MTNRFPQFSFDVRITYADTDRMGVVYYSNYFDMFEKGRTELMRNLGMRYRDMEEHDRVYLPGIDARCLYYLPAKYDDLIRIETRVKEFGGAHIDFEYDIYDVETSKHLASGFTRHPFVNDKWKPVRIPANLKAKLTGNKSS
jgi:acyl-CoA thioester hydrolase